MPRCSSLDLPSSLPGSRRYLVGTGNKVHRAAAPMSTNAYFLLDFSPTKSVVAPAGFPVLSAGMLPCSMPKSLPVGTKFSPVSSCVTTSIAIALASQCKSQSAVAQHLAQRRNAACMRAASAPVDVVSCALPHSIYYDIYVERMITEAIVRWTFVLIS